MNHSATETAFVQQFELQVDPIIGFSRQIAAAARPTGETSAGAGWRRVCSFMKMQSFSLDVRPADDRDAERLAELLEELGYDTAREGLAGRLANLASDARASVLVALEEERGSVPSSSSSSRSYMSVALGVASPPS